jgi:hypothetical protein
MSHVNCGGLLHFIRKPIGRLGGEGMGMSEIGESFSRRVTDEMPERELKELLRGLGGARRGCRGREDSRGCI